MINTKEINELMYAMHDTINVPATPPKSHILKVNNTTFKEFECPKCGKMLCAWNIRTYYFGMFGEIMYNYPLFGGKYSQCPKCGQPLEWRDKV